MVIKGRARSNGVQLAGYLLNEMRNEHVAILAINHPDRDNLHTALADMQDMTDRGQRGTKGLYHAQISPAPGYDMSPEQWLDCVSVLGHELGLDRQPHALVLHEKDGRIHAHVVWQRTDPDALTLISDSNNYAAHERAARQLEAMFEHECVPGPHTGKAKDDNSYSRSEQQQGERAALSPPERKAQITALWERCDSGQSFAAALAEAGYVLARGDQRGLVIVDEAGEVHALSRQIKGVKTKQVEARLDHIDKEKLPDVTEALKLQMQNREERFEELDPQKDKAEGEAETEGETEGGTGGDAGAGQMQGAKPEREFQKPEETERRLRAMTRSVITVINEKIQEVTENSSLYQAARKVIVQVKEKLTGFMRGIGLIASDEGGQPQQVDMSAGIPDQTAAPERQPEVPPQAAAKDGQRESFDWRAAAEARKEEMRRAHDQERAEDQKAKDEGREQEHEREKKRRAIEEAMERAAKERERERDRD